MNDFLQMVLSLLMRGIVLALIAGMLCIVILTIAYFIYKNIRKSTENFPWKNYILIIVFVGYLAVLLYATLFRYVGGGFSNSNFHLFRAWIEAWNNCSLKNWLNVFLNIGLFVPLGFLLPYIKNGFKKWYVSLGTGIITSLLIEIIQYFTGRGLFDVDDLLTNAIGVMLGYCIAMIITHLTNKANRKKCLPYLIYPILFISLITGIFVKYELQEYGNLPQAPVMKANVENIEWIINFELNSEEKNVATYTNEPYTKASCDEFGAEFAQMINISFPDIYYYDNSTIFANHSTGDFLTVNYFDRSYEYSVGNIDFSLGDEEIDEETMRKLLEPYNIDIPESALFSYEGNGQHKFTVNMDNVGDSIMDGTVTCRVKKGNILERIDNRLVVYSPYSEVEIISEKEAYEQVCRGEFYGSERIEYYKPENIEIISCLLDYRIDTKGFYQPVYVFGTREDADNIGEIIIPAMK